MTRTRKVLRIVATVGCAATILLGIFAVVTTVCSVKAEAAETHWYDSVVYWADVRGVTAGDVNPQAPVNRGDAIWMLYKAAVPNSRIANDKYHCIYECWHSGITDALFLDDTLTKAQAVALIYRMIEIGNPDPVSMYACPFSDVSRSAWYAVPVGWAYSNRIVNGDIDGYFKPDKLVTAAEYLTMLNKAFAY